MTINELAKLAKNGDKHSMELILLHYKPKIEMISKDEDFVQEFYVKLIETVYSDRKYIISSISTLFDRVQKDIERKEKEVKKYDIVSYEESTDELYFDDYSIFTEVPWIWHSISTLTLREEKVIMMRMNHKSLEEIAEMFNLTRERIRQIESKAKRKLKHPSRLGYEADSYKRKRTVPKTAVSDHKATELSHEADSYKRTVPKTEVSDHKPKKMVKIHDYAIDLYHAFKEELRESNIAAPVAGIDGKYISRWDTFDSKYRITIKEPIDSIFSFIVQRVEDAKKKNDKVLFKETIIIPYYTDDESYMRYESHVRTLARTLLFRIKIVEGIQDEQDN